MPTSQPAGVLADAAAPSPRRPRAWAFAALETVVAVGLGLILFLASFTLDLEEFADQPPAGVVAIHLVDLAIGLLLGLPIGPLRFLARTRAGTVLHVVVAALGGLSVTALPAALIALYRLGRQRRRALDLVALGLLALTTVVLMALDSAARGTAPSWTWAVAVLLGVGIGLLAVLLGRLAGSRTALVASLQEQAEAADRERAAAERAREAAELARRSAEQAREAAELARASAEATARAEERTAIARDMHDSVSHHLSTIAMHAGAMNYRKDLPPEQLRRIAGTVRDAAQQANGELREVLLALRSESGTGPLASAPTLQDIVEAARDRGQEVTLTWHGTSPAELDQRGRSTVVALSRILGETVANAAKHAPRAPLRVVLARHEDTLILTAVNPLPSTEAAADEAPVDARTAPGDGPVATGAASDGAPALSTGHGLVGIQERARLLGGDARSGSDGERFEVEAWMPW